MKIVILGASGTGKSSLCKKFVALSQRQSSSGMYPTDADFDGETLSSSRQEYVPTIEDGYQTTVDGETVEIIDTAGLERFSHLRSTYMQVGDAFILVYSITSAASLLVLGPLHEELQELRNRLGLPKAHVQIVGTKADQVSTRQVSTRQCARIAMDAKLPLPIIETFSLKSDSTPPSHPNDASNVYIAFASLVRRHQEMRISAALDTGKLKTSQWCCIVS